MFHVTQDEWERKLHGYRHMILEGQMTCATRTLEVKAYYYDL
jgi:hypothetical protein